MTKQEIYEQVVHLTSELHATNVAEKIFSAAKEGDSKKVEEAFENFKKEYPDLFSRIVGFGEEYNNIVDDLENDNNGEIWGDEESEEDEDEESEGEEVLVFDKNTIDSLSLYVFAFFAVIEEVMLFDSASISFETFVSAIEETGYENLADFVADYNWKDFVGEENDYPTIYELLVDIFKGEFKDEEDEWDEDEEETE